MDPDSQHDCPSADDAVRDMPRGADELCGPSGALGPAESAAGLAGADGGKAGRGRAELGGGVSPGGAERGGWDAGGTSAVPLPVLQE